MKINIWQIHYDENSKKLIDKGFIPLDNSTSERPDWYEFWPMRQTFRSVNLEENQWYGILSPKFALKTGYSSAKVHEYINSHGKEADVASFTSTWDFIAYFQNAFEQGEVWHEGITELAQEFYDAIGLPLSVKDIVHYSKNSVTSNYIIARPNFWQEWLGIADQLYAICEDKTVLSKKLNAETTYGPKKVAFKVFIQERIAPVLLSVGKYKTIVPDQSASGRVFEALFYKDERTRKMLQTCDLLKEMYCISGDAVYLEVYKKMKANIPTKPTRFR